jgi:hypothetical protein
MQWINDKFTFVFANNFPSLLINKIIYIPRFIKENYVLIFIELFLLFPIFQISWALSTRIIQRGCVPQVHILLCFFLQVSTAGEFRVLSRFFDQVGHETHLVDISFFH